MPDSNPLFNTSVITEIIAGQLPLLLLIAGPAAYFAYRGWSSAWAAAAVAAFGGWLVGALSDIWCQYEVAIILLDLMHNPDQLEEMRQAAALRSGPLTPCFTAAGESFVMAAVIAFSAVAIAALAGYGIGWLFERFAPRLTAAAYPLALMAGPVVAVLASRVVWIDGLGILGMAARLLWVMLLVVALVFPFANRRRAKTTVQGKEVAKGAGG
jgi:ABC-type glycerol-3-phosphate transport system permease component